MAESFDTFHQFPNRSSQHWHYRNALREVFDQVADRREWKEAVLRAFQTWSVHANVNIGLVPDRGDDFGAVGLSSDDPRFGEFRIGAFPQTEVLANTLPYQTSAGTWSGDILLNTHVNYFLGDWKSGGPISVPPPNAKGPAVELYSVILHEVGNALGIADNNIAGAVLNGTYSGPNGTLKSSDIAAIRQLYGPRVDHHEPASNNNRGTATVIPTPAGYTGSVPLLARGSLRSLNDVDFYRFHPLKNQEKVSVRLWASGISLLKASLEVQDRFGNKIADVKADDVFENNLQIDVGSLKDHPTLFIKVSRNANDVFAIGDYRIELDYRPLSEQPSLKPPSHDADLEDDDDGGVIDYVSVDALFAQAGMLESEVGEDDTLATARSLSTTFGFLPNTRYESTASIASSQDRDLFRFRAPNFASPVLNITIDPVGIENPELEAILLDAQGNRVASRMVKKPDGGSTITMLNPQANREFILFVRADQSSPIERGNYVVTMNFATNGVDTMQFVYGARTTPAQEHFSEFIVPKTQLYRFDLVTISPTIANGGQVTFYDASNGNIVGAVAAAGNSRGTGYLWLTTGTYIIRASTLTQDGSTARPINFRLLAEVLSDDQGPLPIDPTQPQPPNNQPDFNWNPGVPGQRPNAVEFADPAFESPWTSQSTRTFSRNYYQIYLA